MNYPETHRDSLVGDTLHGTYVADPYRWLENDTSAETAAWVEAQNKVTQAYLSAIPFRDELAKRYGELYDFPKLGGPSRVGDRYFIWKNSGLQNQFVIYSRLGLDREDEVREHGREGGVQQPYQPGAKLAAINIFSAREI